MTSQIRRLITQRRYIWLLVGAAVLLVILFAVSNSAFIGGLSLAGLGGIGAFALITLLVVGLVVQRVRILSQGNRELAVRLAEAERLVETSTRQLETIFQINQKFVEASDENEVIEPVLHLLVEITGAQGASFVPLDEHGQPQAAISHGEFPLPVIDAWVEHLASPSVRERCRNCKTLENFGRREGCPLLEGPFSQTSGLYCLPVRRGEHEFGIVNLFFSDPATLDENMMAYLRALLDETAQGLERVHLRRRELAALRQMQVLRQQTDLSALLKSLLENIHHTLQADFGLMAVPHLGPGPHGEARSEINLTIGDFPYQAQPFIDGVLQGVMTSGEAVLIGDVAGAPASPSGVKSLVAAPLISPEGSVLGVVLAGDRRRRGFHQRQLALLQTVAGQVALVVQNANLIEELEYKTMIQERTRLAREIHDGLAQTVALMKLQAVQLRKYLAHGELERARQNIDLLNSTLNEAYQDARQAIDGLRISPAECGLGGWLVQTVEDFQEISGLPVELSGVKVQPDMPPEIHAQLIRILQEALSNVRKHARASRVWVACSQTVDDLHLEVRDDGLGFSPEDVTRESRHGLRGMRERAELIGADFQVVSRPGEGTTVKVRLPLGNLEGAVL